MSHTHNHSHAHANALRRQIRRAGPIGVDPANGGGSGGGIVGPVGSTPAGSSAAAPTPAVSSADPHVSSPASSTPAAVSSSPTPSAAVPSSSAPAATSPAAAVSSSHPASSSDSREARSSSGHTSAATSAASSAASSIGSASATLSGTGTAAAASSSSTAAAASSGHGISAGGVVGILIAVGAVFGLGYFAWRRYSANKQRENDHAAIIGPYGGGRNSLENGDAFDNGAGGPGSEGGFDQKSWEEEKADREWSAGNLGRSGTTMTGGGNRTSSWGNDGPLVAAGGFGALSRQNTMGFGGGPPGHGAPYDANPYGQQNFAPGPAQPGMGFGMGGPGLGMGPGSMRAPPPPHLQMHNAGPGFYGQPPPMSPIPGSPATPQMAHLNRSPTSAHAANPLLPNPYGGDMNMMSPPPPMSPGTPFGPNPLAAGPGGPGGPMRQFTASPAPIDRAVSPGAASNPFQSPHGSTFGSRSRESAGSEPGRGLPAALVAGAGRAPSLPPQPQVAQQQQQQQEMQSPVDGQQQQDPFSNHPDTGKVFNVVRTFEPNPDMDDELLIYPGDKVLLYQTYDDGWSAGVNLSHPEPRKQGVFPRDCVEEAPASEQPTQGPAAGAQQSFKSIPEEDEPVAAQEATYPPSAPRGVPQLNHPDPDAEQHHPEHEYEHHQQETLVSPGPPFLPPLDLATPNPANGGPQSFAAQQQASTDAPGKRTSSLIASRDADLFVALGEALGEKGLAEKEMERKRMSALGMM